jgi:hypothetical protein
MDRFNNLLAVIRAIFWLVVMAGATYFLWQLDPLWGIGCTVICFGIAWHWWHNGGFDYAADDLTIAHDEKEKLKFWENLWHVLCIPLRFLYASFFRG